MNFADSPTHCCDLFGRATLELTFRALRKKHPALALQIQNALVSVYPRDDYHTGFTAAELPLHSDAIAQIAAALCSLGDEIQVSAPGQRGELAVIRSLMLDWLMLARGCEQRAS